MLRRHFLTALPPLMALGGAATVGSPAIAQSGRDGEFYSFASTAAMSGPLASFGQGMKQGVEAAFRQANARGGLHDRKLRFDVLDDAYVPTRSVVNIKKILDDNDILGLIGCVGTPNNAAIAPLIESTSLVHLAPMTGATSLRRSDSRNVFHVRASYTDETRRLVHNLVGMGIRSLAIVHLDNAYGKEVLGDVNLALEEAGIKTVAEVALATDGKNIDSVAARVLAAKPAAVLLGTAGAATTGVVAALRKGSSLIPIAGISPALTPEGIKQLGESAKGIALTMVFPDPTRAKSQLVREYQTAMKLSGSDNFTPAGLEGYVSGRVMVEALQRSGKDANRDKIRAAIAGIRNFDLGGFVIDYASKPYVGSKFVDLGILSSDGRMRG